MGEHLRRRPVHVTEVAAAEAQRLEAVLAPEIAVGHRHQRVGHLGGAVLAGGEQPRIRPGCAAAGRESNRGPSQQLEGLELPDRLLDRAAAAGEDEVAAGFDEIVAVHAVLLPADLVIGEAEGLGRSLFEQR